MVFPAVRFDMSRPWLQQSLQQHDRCSHWMLREAAVKRSLHLRWYIARMITIILHGLLDLSSMQKKQRHQNDTVPPPAD